MSLTGTWGIVEMDLWDREDIDLIGLGFIEFSKDRASQFRFIACPVTPASVTSSGSSAVLVEQTTQAITALPRPSVVWGASARWLGRRCPSPWCRRTSC